MKNKLMMVFGYILLVILICIIFSVGGCSTVPRGYRNNAVYQCVKDFLAEGLNSTAAFNICNGIYGDKPEKIYNIYSATNK